MPKAYWVGSYRAIHDTDKLAAYAKLAGPAIEGAGGRFLARGNPVKVYDNGLMQRTVLVEFPSAAAAMAAHDCDGYQKALAALDGGADRDIRIVEAAEGHDGAGRGGKGYWVSLYRKVLDQAKVDAYRKLTGSAIADGGGKFLARGMPAKTYENGVSDRVILIEFDSVATAIATHDGPAYQKALAALDGGIDREIRMVEGLA